MTFLVWKVPDGTASEVALAIVEADERHQAVTKYIKEQGAVIDSTGEYCTLPFSEADLKNHKVRCQLVEV